MKMKRVEVVKKRILLEVVNGVRFEEF